MKSDKNKIYNLTVEEAYKLLRSKDMANNRCNIQIYKQTPGTPGGNHNGRKPGSKNKITLKYLNSKIDKLAKIVQDGFTRQEQFNNFVLDQFKKHGWIK